MKKIFVLFFVLSMILGCAVDNTKNISDSDNLVVDAELDGESDNFVDEVVDSSADETEDTVDETLEETDDDADDVDECEGFVPMDCDESYSICTGFNIVKACVTTKCGKTILESECPESSGCFNGVCTNNICSDECVPGEEKDGKVCEYWDNTKGEWTTTDQTGSLYDRFEEFQRWQHRDLMPFGGVADVYYESESLEKVSSYDGVGDSAIWTGTYLASESIRYMVDGSVAARENIKNLVETLHLFFNVAGTPGLLSRYAYESQYRSEMGVKLLGNPLCESDNIFCDILYDGKLYDYKGHISRDQYQGILMGYSFAYDALKGVDEESRTLIREDIVEFVQEIMKKRDVEVRFSYDNLPPGGLKLTNIEMRFMIFAPRESADGSVHINYCSVEDADCSTSMSGMQEFMPNVGLLLHQLNSNLPDNVERPGSGMMLANIFNIGMQVTEGVEGYEDIYNEFKNFYYFNDDQWGNIYDWLEQMQKYAYHGECGDAYYGININMEPMYNLLRLEKDAVLRNLIYETVLQAKLWETVKTHKNTFFAYIYASQGGFSGDIVEDATTQFRDFQEAPHVFRATNLLDNPKYATREDGCTDQVSHDISVDIIDRKPGDFIWQRHPFELVNGGDPRKVFSGVDYMIVYWMGRHYGYIEDDSAGRCFRWK